jgi:hypothetical protein
MKSIALEFNTKLEDDNFLGYGVVQSRRIRPMSRGAYRLHHHDRPEEGSSTHLPNVGIRR